MRSSQSSARITAGSQCWGTHSHLRQTNPDDAHPQHNRRGNGLCGCAVVALFSCAVVALCQSCGMVMSRKHCSVVCTMHTCLLLPWPLDRHYPQQVLQGMLKRCNTVLGVPLGHKSSSNLLRAQHSTVCAVAGLGKPRVHHLSTGQERGTNSS
jgi:hypothetical protein